MHAQVFSHFSREQENRAAEKRRGEDGQFLARDVNNPNARKGERCKTRHTKYKILAVQNRIGNTKLIIAFKHTARGHQTFLTSFLHGFFREKLPIS
jgi:hypothetical protein